MCGQKQNQAIPPGKTKYGANRFGSPNVVKKLLKHREIDVNIQNNHGLTALMIAIQLNKMEIVKLLLENPKILNLQNELTRHLK
jgi:ankyrin repeat protein